jgi:hypothetical protein
MPIIYSKIITRTVTTDWLALLLCSREIRGSNSIRILAAVLLTEIFLLLLFSQSLQNNCRIELELHHDCIRH